MNYCWILVVAFALARFSSVELRPYETIIDQNFLRYLLDLEKRLLEESGLSFGNDVEYLESEDALQGSLKSMIEALKEELKRLPALIANGKWEEAHILMDGLVSAILNDENSIMKIKEQLKRMSMITKLYNDLASAEASETAEATNAISELMKEIGEGDEEEGEKNVIAYKRNNAVSVTETEDGGDDDEEFDVEEVKDKKRAITKGETVTEIEVKDVDIGAS